MFDSGIIHKSATVWLFAMTLSILHAPAASAKLTVWEDGEKSLKLFGYTRMRVEQDSDSNKDSDRSRVRSRLRFGGEFNANKDVQFGFRLATASDSHHSTHHTLALNEGGAAESDFGLDRVYMKIGFGTGFFIGGKFKAPIYDPGEFLFDGDFNMEGAGFGLKAKLGGAKLGALLAYAVLNEGGWGADDSMILFQASLKGGKGLGYRLAVGGSIVTDAEEENLDKDSFPGRSATYSHIVGELKAKSVAFKPRLGFGYAISDVKDSVIGQGSTSYDKNAMMAYLRGKAGKFGFRAYWFDMGYASAPGLGAFSADNFPYPVNFTGYRLQIDFPKIKRVVSWDLRYYSQSTKNEDISVWNSKEAMEGADHSRSRVQVNLNVKF